MTSDSVPVPTPDIAAPCTCAKWDDHVHCHHRGDCCHCPCVGTTAATERRLRDVLTNIQRLVGYILPASDVELARSLPDILRAESALTRAHQRLPM